MLALRLLFPWSIRRSHGNGNGVEVGDCTYAASVVAFPMSLKICLSMLVSEDLSPFVKSFWPSVNRGHRGQTQRESFCMCVCARCRLMCVRWRAWDGYKQHSHL